MPTTDYTLDELRHAYQVLGVPVYSSSHAIKQAYRALIKRWHPDLSAAGTPAQAEATQMMELVNDAYAKIQHAPLRYYADSYSQVQARSRQVARSSTYQPSDTSGTIPPLNTDSIEFWVRFVFGAVAGAFLSIRLVLSLYEHPAILMISVAVAIVGLGFASARFGDKFWHATLRNWWLWW